RAPEPFVVGPSVADPLSTVRGPTIWVATTSPLRAATSLASGPVATAPLATNITTAVNPATKVAFSQPMKRPNLVVGARGPSPEPRTISPGDNTGSGSTFCPVPAAGSSSPPPTPVLSLFASEGVPFLPEGRRDPRKAVCL